MRKNKMMRLASVLLVLTLLTTSVISGTFAKYTTTASGSDTARVAKWGVTVGSSGTLFDYQYMTDDTTEPKDGSSNAISYSVVSSNTNPVSGGGTVTTAGDYVVAPGTKNDTGITFTLTGTPEVAVKVEVKVTGKDSADSATDIFLAAGTYSDLTTGNDAKNTFNVSDGGYYPVKFTLKDGTNTLVNGGKLSEVESALEKLSGSYAANTNLGTLNGTDNGSSGSYTLTWAWDYGTGDNDAADTLLGNLAADSTTYGVSLTSGTNYSTDICLGVSITVTQID